MDIQKYIHHGQDEPIFHSNAYARVASGSSIGSTDAQTFQERMNIHRNRRAVRHYGDSMIGRGNMREVARTQIKNPLRRSEGRASRQQLNRGTVIPQRPSFQEPSTRRYNPYG
jgi:hypothetical protein